MSSKILVADDSPTIQKVVSITLAGADYELDSALDEKEIFEKLASNSYELVLLDFNISEERSGYDLAKSIGEQSPSTKTLVMLGTFDTVDDHSMSESGVVDQIVKPFESSLFVEKVKAALEGSSSTSSEPINLESTDTEWEMGNVPSQEDDTEIDMMDSSTDSGTSNPLSDVISGWGMSVPSVIGGGEDLVGMPPKMNEENGLTEGADLARQISEDEEFEEITEEVLMPAQEELDYPELNLDDSIAEEAAEPTSKLVSLDELESDGDHSEDEELEDTDPQFVIGPSEDSPDLVNALEEDITPDEFWAADHEDSGDDSSESEEMELIDLGEGDEDEFSIDQHASMDLSADPQEIASPTIDALNDLSENQNSDIGPKLERESSAFDYGEVLDRLKEDLRPFISEVVREVLADEMGDSNSQAAEKVAWEIIPDLAENLIRKEVESLSKKVQDKHSLS